MRFDMVRKVFFVAVILVLTVCLGSASADPVIIDSGTCGENATWTLDDQGVLEISGSGDMYYFDIQGTEWYQYHENIFQIIIHNGITSIGSCAFYGCSKLNDISIPSGVTRIENYAFYGCSSLTGITIPSGVTRIDGSAFQDCSSLSEITIPSGVTRIESSAFQGCSSLSEITIPSGVTRIGTFAFQGCSSLTGITLPNGITRIEGHAFDGCSSLSKITIPSSVTSIEANVFLGCSSLSEITILSGVTSIGAKAFQDCINLTGITIPSSVTSIGDYAFSYCKSLSEITIPSGVTSIGDYAFESCSSLTAITIPSGVTRITNGTFSGCTSLTAITIRNSVTSIGQKAFYACLNLTEIAIPDSVTSIGDEAFADCPKLTGVSIPNSVNSIASNAFSHCRNLTIYCYENSYAEQWARENEVNLQYLNQKPLPVQIGLPKTFDVQKGNTKTMILNAMPAGSYTVNWSSSDPSVVTVDDQGNLTGIAKGKSVITATCVRSDKSVLTASSTVNCYIPLESFSLNPDEVWLVRNESYQIRPLVVPEDAESKFSYTVISGKAVGGVSSQGEAYSIAIGDMSIAVQAGSGEKHTLTLHSCYPVQSIAFNPDEIQIGNEPQPISATVSTSGGDYINKLVTFDTSNSSIVTVDNDGMLYPHKAGTATITATASNGVSASCTVTVVVEGHIPVTTIPAVEPTCTEPGRTAQIVCSDCGATLAISKVIPALGHDITAYEAKAPTCTERGWDAYESCSRCEYSTYAGELPALGHDIERHEAKAPTCTEPGWDAYETCARCDYSTYVEIPELGHSVVTDAYIAPTRTSWGVTSGSHCGVCGEILEGNEPIAPLKDEAIVSLPLAVEGVAEETYMGSGVVCVRVNGNCGFIAARAFAQCGSLVVIEIPDSVTEIAADAFEGDSLVTIVTSEGSYAEQYAKEQKIRYLIHY